MWPDTKREKKGVIYLVTIDYGKSYSYVSCKGLAMDIQLQLTPSN